MPLRISPKGLLFFFAGTDKPFAPKGRAPKVLVCQNIPQPFAPKGRAPKVLSALKASQAFRRSPSGAKESRAGPALFFFKESRAVSALDSFAVPAKKKEAPSFKKKRGKAFLEVSGPDSFKTSGGILSNASEAFKAYEGAPKAFVCLEGFQKIRLRFRFLTKLSGV